LISDTVFVSGGEDKVLNLWNLSNLENPHLKTVNINPGGNANCLVLSVIGGNNDRLAVANDRDVFLFKIIKNDPAIDLEPEAVLKGHNQDITSISNVSDTEFLTSSRDGACKLWVLSTKECKKTFNPFNGSWVSSAFFLDSKTLMCVTPTG